MHPLNKSVLVGKDPARSGAPKSQALATAKQRDTKLSAHAQAAGNLVAGRTRNDSHSRTGTTHGL